MVGRPGRGLRRADAASPTRHRAGRPASASASARRARPPEHVVRALVVGVARGDEQQVRQPVEVFQRRRADALALGLRPAAPPRARRGGRPCAPHAARPRPASRPAGRTRSAARARRSAASISALQPLHLASRMRRSLLAGRSGVARSAPEVEQVVLHARQHGVEHRRLGQVRPRQADAGVESRRPRHRPRPADASSAPARRWPAGSCPASPVRV